MRIRIFLGTGGVGKTSVSAASALGAALEGKRCLVLTIDPALRLRTALGLDAAGLEQQVPLERLSASGELWAALLDVRASLDRAVLRYAESQEQAQIILNHPIYQVLIESLAGMQELMAMERIDQALGDGYDDIFIDTAPSRHAFEFLDKPEFFAQLVSFPLVRLVGRTYKWWERSRLGRLGRMSFELYSRVEEMLGATLVRQVLDFFSVFRKIAEGYGDRARRTLALLHDPQTTGFTIVTTPFKARRDGEFFVEELRKRNFPAESMVVNRLWPPLQAALPPTLSPLGRNVAGWYQSVSDSHRKIWETLSAEFRPRIPRLIPLPELSKDVDGLPALLQIARELSQAEAAPDMAQSG